MPRPPVAVYGIMFVAFWRVGLTPSRSGNVDIRFLNAGIKAPRRGLGEGLRKGRDPAVGPAARFVVGIRPVEHETLVIHEVSEEPRRVRD